jgi:hypothetical protein
MTEPTVAQFHADIPQDMQGLPFDELAWYLFNRLDALPDLALTPEILRELIVEHRDYALTRHAQLCYTVVSTKR